MNPILTPLKLARMPMTRLRERLKFAQNSFPILGDWVAGLAVGMLFLSIFSRLRLALGDSAEVSIGLLWSACIAVLVCVTFFQRSSKWQTLLASWLLVCWTLLQPAVLEMALNSVSQFSMAQLSQSATQSGITFIIVLTSLFPFMLGTMVIAVQPNMRKSLFTIGFASSLFAMPILLGQFDFSSIANWGALSILALIGTSRFVWDHSVTGDEHAVTVSRIPLERTEAALLNFSIGSALAIALFVGRQLLLSNLVTELALLGGFIAGVGTAGVVRTSLSGTQRWLILSVWGAVMILAYPLLTYLALTETVWISNVFTLFICRSVLLCCLTCPLGVLLSRKSSPQTPFVTKFFGSLFCFSLGFSIALWSGISAKPAIYCLVTVSSLLAIARMLTSQEYPRTKFATARFASVIAVILLGCVFSSRFDPARSEKVLFTGNTYAAFRGGIDWELLPWLDDGRLLSEQSNLKSRWSLWKQRGQQVMARQNGLITEIQTDNVTACPMTASEVLPSLFPLIAHPAAEHVLVLGLHSSTLRTCESFPLRSLTVVDGAEFFEPMKEWASAKLIDVENIEFFNADLQLAMKAKHTHQYDLIIVPNSIAATTSGVAELTQEFYASVRSHLNQGGVFCQRLAFYDLGPVSVRQFVATFKQVFPQVLVVESVPGEVLLVGAEQEKPLITRELFQRLQLPQTRRILSEIGWDWSIPASRGTLDDQAVQKWIAATDETLSIRKVNSLFQLPAEIARWESKSLQTRRALAKHGMALGGYLGEGEESLDIQQRLEDLQIAQNILDNNPDNIWGYRAALKKQLTERPRGKIMQVKHEGLKRRLHPDDQRRKDYLQALGNLAKIETPSLESVNDLVQYMQPYDPLLGPFVSNEAYHQLKRVADSTESAQYFNLLYSIYFSTAADKSVRNVCTATKLLCEHPEIVTDETERWDQLNGLIEIFRHRWQLRFQDHQRQSKYESIDTELSIAAIKLTLTEMEKLYTSANLSPEDWNSRQEIIQESLVRPLRVHRSQQLRKRTGKAAPAKLEF